MIGFGHRWEEIQNYTFAQIKLFIEACVTLEAEHRRNRLLETAIASQGDNKAIKEAIEKLS